MAHSPSCECCLERVSMLKRRIVSCVKHRQPAEAWTTLILKLSRPGLSFHGAPPEWLFILDKVAIVHLPAVWRWVPLSSNSQLRTHYWNKHSYATSAAGPSSSRCSNVEETAQLRRVRGRVEDTYRYKNRTCRCRLGLTHLLSAWFSLGVRSQIDRGKTNDGDATSIHPCSMYGEPSQAVL